MTECYLWAVEGPERLDRFLAAQLPDWSRSRLQKLIAQGHVTRNDRPCSEKNVALKPGDRVALTVPAPVTLTATPQPLSLDILYEDEDILVLNKPVGLVVHPAPGHADGTLVNALLAHGAVWSGINGVLRPGIVHRLDKDTSGVMVVAKHDRAHQHLQQQIQTKTARREYLGIVVGCPKADTGTIEAPIARHPRDRQRMAVVATGRYACTHWRVLERLQESALLHFDLATGRTHQIRVHCAHMQHPLLGDRRYGKPVASLPGQALHAARLTLIHPSTGQTLSFAADPPPPFWQAFHRRRRDRSALCPALPSLA
ncbi:MAG: RluA family pseudouridine synthase [Pseudanabaenaceae cyanobacterium]